MKVFTSDAHWWHTTTHLKSLFFFTDVCVCVCVCVCKTYLRIARSFQLLFLTKFIEFLRDRPEVGKDIKINIKNTLYFMQRNLRKLGFFFA